MQPSETMPDDAVELWRLIETMGPKALGSFTEELNRLACLVEAGAQRERPSVLREMGALISNRAARLIAAGISE